MNVEAYESRVSQCRGELLREIFKLTRNLDVAEDMVQEAIVKGYEKLDQYRDEEPLQDWLYTIAKNTNFNRIIKETGSKRKVNGERKPKRKHVSTDSMDTHIAELIRGTTSQEQYDQADLERTEVVNYLKERCKPDVVDTALLVMFENVSIKDASAMLNVPQGTVQSRTGRARAALKAGIQAGKILRHVNPAVFKDRDARRKERAAYNNPRLKDKVELV